MLTKKDELTDICVHIVHIHTQQKKSNFSAKIKRREKSYEGKNIFEQLSKENSGLQTLLSHAKYFHSVIVLKWEWKGSPKIINPLISPISTRAILKVINSS